MKNMFGKPKKIVKKEEKPSQNNIFLEKRVVELQNQLQEMKDLYEQVLNELKNTESQKKEETLKQENSDAIEENETINYGAETETFHEPDYVILPEPEPRRRKAIDILEKEAVKEVVTNRREIIKQKIINELRKQELSAKDLKTLFVDEYEYCSKATFYRYLESLREEERIDSIKINGKEYLCSIPSKIDNNTTF